MSKEIWKPIVGIDGYWVSTYGRLKIKKKIKKYTPDPRGYIYFMPLAGTTLSGRFFGKTRISIHRVVAITFLGEPPFPNYEVNHKDENPSNNRVSNLEWVSHQKNIIHSRQRISDKQLKGKDNIHSKPIIQFHKGIIVRRWESCGQASREGGFDKGAISKCLSGKRFTHKGFSFSFDN